MPGGPAMSSQEQLRRDLANHGRPASASVVFQARCRRRKSHPLLWVTSVGGSLVPVARRYRKGERHVFSFSAGEDGQPVPLSEWPPDPPVPQGQCRCGVETNYSAADLLGLVQRGVRKELLPS